MTHSGRYIPAAVVLLVTFGVTSALGQNSLKYSLSDHMQIGPIRQALYSPTPAHLLIQIQTGVIELNKQSSRIDSTRGFDGTIITSVLGGVVGGVAGIAAALALVPLSGAEGWDQLGVFGLGFLVFEPLGIGIGAHLGNGARGNLGAAIGSSYGMLLLGGLASMAIASATEVPIGIIIPILQVGGAVYVERNTMK